TSSYGSRKKRAGYARLGARRAPLANPPYAKKCPAEAGHSFHTSIGASVEPSRRVRQHGVDLAGFRGEVGPRHGLAALVARYLVEQALELADVAVHRLAEVAVGAVALAGLVEGLT